MSKHVIETWPQDQYSFRVFDNSARLRDWPEVMAAAGPDCVGAINLAYFALAAMPNDGIKYFDHQSAIMTAGKWGMEPQYHEYGICIDAGGRMTLGTERGAVYDYAVAVPPAVINGRVYNNTRYGTNGCTYTGLRADGAVVTLLCSKDKGMSSAEAVAAMREAGCVHIFRWDGSWSSRGCLGPGKEVTPSKYRMVRSWMLIFRCKKEASPVDEITQAMMTNNPCYTNGRTITPKGLMVHSTGTPGATAEELRRSMDKATAQASVDAVIDDTVTLQTLPWEARAWHCGGSGNNTHISFEICEPHETRLLPINWRALYRGAPWMDPWAVKRWQSELKRVGLYSGEIDGSFGPGTEAATKAMQDRLGLAADGSCGRATLEAAAAQDGSLMAYPVKDVQPYFDAVYARAVSLSAYLCKRYGFNPLEDIVCHSEGYDLGIASNHADVMHWFPKHGKSMDEFRREVKAAMTEEDKPDADAPAAWADTAWAKAKSRGVLDGTRPAAGITRQEVAVVLDNLGLL